MILYHKKLCLLKYVLRSQTIIFAFMITDDRIEHLNVCLGKHSTFDNHDMDEQDEKDWRPNMAQWFSYIF